MALQTLLPHLLLGDTVVSKAKPKITEKKINATYIEIIPKVLIKPGKMIRSKTFEHNY